MAATFKFCPCDLAQNLGDVLQREIMAAIFKTRPSDLQQTWVTYLLQRVAMVTTCKLRLSDLQ